MKTFKFLREEKTLMELFLEEAVMGDDIPAEHELYRVLNISIDHQHSIHNNNPNISAIIFRIYRNEVISYPEAQIISITNRVIELWDDVEVDFYMRDLVANAWMTVDIEAEKSHYISDLIRNEEF